MTRIAVGDMFGISGRRSELEAALASAERDAAGEPGCFRLDRHLARTGEQPVERQLKARELGRRVMGVQRRLVAPLADQDEPQFVHAGMSDARDRRVQSASRGSSGPDPSGRTAPLTEYWVPSGSRRSVR